MTNNMTREQAIEICGLAAIEAVEAKSADYAQNQGSAEDGHYFTAGVCLPDSADYSTLTVHYAPIANEDMPDDGDLGSIDWKISHYSVA